MVLDEVIDLLANAGQDVGSLHELEEIENGGEDVIQVPWYLLPIRHFIRGLIPRWSRFKYFNNEKDAFDPRCQMFANHYQAYRSSLLYCSLFFSALSTSIIWWNWNYCEWSSTGVHADCDPIPSPFRDPASNTGFLKTFRGILYRLSYITPIGAILAWIATLVAAVLNHRRHVLRSKQLIIFSFVVQFLIPFGLQLIPFRHLMDWREEFGGFTFQLNALVANETSYGEPCDLETPGCGTMSDICEIAKGKQFLISFVPDESIDAFEDAIVQRVVDEEGLSEEDARSFVAPEIRDILRDYNATGPSTADSLCFNIFQTSCELKRFEGAKKIDAIDCAEIDDNIVYFWESFAGIIFSARAVKILAPAALALIPGIAKGAKIVKYILPCSAMVGWLMFIKPLIYTPLIIAFALGTYQAVGDAWFALGISFLALSQLSTILFGRGGLQPLTVGGVRKVFLKVTLIQLFFMLLSVVCIILSFTTRDRYFDILSNLGIAASAYRYAKRELGVLLINVFANLFTGALTFTDIVMGIVVDIYEKEKLVQLRGREDQREDVLRLFQDDPDFKPRKVAPAPLVGRAGDDGQGDNQNGRLNNRENDAQNAAAAVAAAEANSTNKA